MITIKCQSKIIVSFNCCVSTSLVVTLNIERMSLDLTVAVLVIVAVFVPVLFF